MGYKKMYGDAIEFDQENKYVNIPSTSVLKLAGTSITATAARLNAAGTNAVTTNVTAAGALAPGVSTVNAAAGIALTLPAATGSGNRFEVCIGTTISSLATTITAAAGDFFGGMVLQAKIGTGIAIYAMNGTSHSILTFDGTTKGGIKGDKITLIDVAADLWNVQVVQQASGAVASPIS